MSVRSSVHAAGIDVKFLDLFGKTPVRDAHKARAPDEIAAALRDSTTHKIDTIESEIAAELGISELLPASDDITPAARLEQQIEEACLLHASGQPEAASALLAEATARPVTEAPERERLAWLMRLELAAFDGNQSLFEDIALGYAQRFESSPPQWRGAQLAIPAPPTVVSPLSFRGKLCGNASPALSQLEQLATRHAAIRLDLSGVTDVDADGCRLLLALLRRWQAAGTAVVIADDQPLLALLRAQICEGRRDPDDAIWLLLLELLRERDLAAYEAACLAYSLTYEISPPAAPTAAPPGTNVPGQVPLPTEIRLPLDSLLASVAHACRQADTVLLDGRQLVRVDFAAAAPLLSGITRVAGGKPVEWRDTPFLVSTLLQLVAGGGALRIINRKP